MELPRTPLRDRQSPTNFSRRWYDMDTDVRTPESVIHHDTSDSSESIPPPKLFSHASFEFETEEMRTPESVIHHDTSDSSELEPPPKFFSRPSIDTEEIKTPESMAHQKVPDTTEDGEWPLVPQPLATVKASGGRLKTRPSATVADLQQLRDADAEMTDEQSTSEDAAGTQENNNTDVASGNSKQPGDRVTLDFPIAASGEGLGFGLDAEFDRLLETQKRGYLMRQNTKVVVASNRVPSSEKQDEQETKSDDNSLAVPKADAARGTRSAGNTPARKASGALTTEPWNGKMRRHSTRRSIISPVGKGSLSGSGSQASGLESHDLSVLAEDTQSMLEDPGSGAEQGRFFVNVVALKDLKLPLPRNEQMWFQLTLDNGLHCVTTAWLELGKNAPIGQEFELTVFDDLDFSLTLQTKIERPKSQASDAASTTSASSPSKAKAKGSAFSRFLSSPKKRREQERKQQEEEALAARQKRQELEAQRASSTPTSWDLLHHIIGTDGSFARSIVSLEDHEQKAYGRPYTVSVPCFNQWAMDDSMAASSTKSKHGGVQRKPPYEIGQLTLQMLYVPKPKGVEEDDMPQSMNACIKQLKEAEANLDRQFEGHLSQQGGDCPYWRRRFFRLNGSFLTSYHETTRQRRANINLAKAVKLIDDRSSLTQSGDAASPVKGKGRRKSAFAIDEEGYMFVEEGFRMKFANGEVIDFYADSREEKNKWMDVLSGAVGKDTSVQKPSWTSVVLTKERAEAAKKASDARPAPPSKIAKPTTGFRSAPTSPNKSVRPQSTLYEKSSSSLGKENNPPSPAKSSSRPSSPTKSSAAKKRSVPESRTPRPDASAKRKAVRSMIF